ncbi:Uncharacterised protein [Vibrio cholerae]|nr:Uncharacterised protein [Vibrio cholerae]
MISAHNMSSELLNNKSRCLEKNKFRNPYVLVPSYRLKISTVP